MKKLISFYTKTPLILRIAIGMVIGIILGLTLPDTDIIKLFGDFFVGALKGIAPILVFTLVISSLAKAGKGLGKRFRSVISYYMLSTFLAAAFAVVAFYLFPVVLPVGQNVEQADVMGLSEIFTLFFKNMVTNPITALSEGNYFAILTWSIIFGFAIRKLAKDSTKDVLSDLSDAVLAVVRGIIECIPFGIIGLVYGSVHDYGIEVFSLYGELLALLVGCMLFVAFVVDPFIVFISLRKNPYPLVFKCFKESGLTALFTRSSAATIPVNMNLCEKLGIEKEYYSVAIPLGATINMDGAAITITIMSLVAAFSQGIKVNIFLAIILSFVATLGACGASGVTGGSLLLIPVACSLLGVSSEVAMQMVGVGFVIGIVQDSLETALNATGDVVFTATAEFKKWKKEGREIKF